MIEFKIRAVVASAAIACVAGIASAETKVVGQVIANPSATINAEFAAKRIGSSLVPYIQGDTITTADKSTAAVSLTSGKASFVAAPNTTMKVVNGDMGEVAISSGAVKFSAAAGFPVSFTSSAGTFLVKSDTALDAVAVVDGEKFGVVAKSGSFTIESNNGNAITKVESGDAFSFENSDAGTVDVQLLGAGVSGWLLTGVAFLGGIFVIDEIADDDDDDDPAPVTPPGSPA